MNQQLIQSATDWMNQDPDSETKAELQQLLDAGDLVALEKIFSNRITFGTAGLRGELGAGPSKMNRVLVAQAAKGIANYLLANFDRPKIVIGFDGRINSDVFAKDSAEIFAGAGIETVLFDGYVPTPVLAHSVKVGGFTAGVMVTASHNPPRDNGYKVYLGGSFGGSQIISPIDTEIEREILAVSKTLTFQSIEKSANYLVGDKSLVNQYLEQTLKVIDGYRFTNRLKVVYTAMHGVGLETLSALLEKAGHRQPILVSEQVQPDGTFPTTPFPNPEEPGALNLAFAKAESESADLVIATDPDADRLAVGIPTSKGFRRLSGDEVGLLLAHEIASRPGASGTLANSIVSSSCLARVAEQNGLKFTQTLTGFKWIMRVPDLLFGYEEALGYAIDPGHTPDKDGISAALLLLAIADRTNLKAHLDDLKKRYDFRPTRQVSVRVESKEQVAEIMRKLIANPPTELLGKPVKSLDLSIPTETLPATSGLRLSFENGDWVILRPSGTEPKFKAYLETSEGNLDRLTEELKQRFF